MSSPKKDFIEMFFCVILQISMFNGTSHYLYDCQQHKVVFSTKGCVYCAILHVSFAILAYLYMPQVLVESPLLTGRSAPQLLYKLLLVVNITGITLNLVSLWTGRARAPKLIHKMNHIRWRDFTNFEGCDGDRRRALILVCLKLAWIILVIFVASLGSSSLSQDCVGAIYIVILSSTLIISQFQFFMGMAYAQYLFKLTNWRLFQIVEDINCGKRMSRKKSKSLRVQLTRLGRIHSQLRGLTLEFKDLFQVAVLTVLLTHFLAVVFMFFFCLIVSRSVTSNVQPLERMSAAGTSVLSTIDLLLMFWISREVVKSCNASAEIVKEISSVRVLDSVLEESIEVLCFQLKTEKMHLTVLGMFNLEESGFKMAKAALLHCLLMIQIDYDNI